MAGATGRDVHVDRLISEMAMNYKPEGFVAADIFPIVQVQNQSNIYVDFDRASKLRIQDTRRSPGNEANIMRVDVGSGTYFCNNYALKAQVTIEDRKNADPIYVSGLYDGAAELVLDGLLLDWDNRVALQVTSTTNVGSSTAVSSAWSGAASTPLADINQAIDNVTYSNGAMATDVVFGLEAWNSFRRHADVRNLIFGTNNGGGYPTTAQVAALLGVKRVHVGGSFKNTADEGQSESLASIWLDNVLVYHRPDSPSIQRPSFAYSFRWAQPGLPNMVAERHPYDTRRKTEEIEIGYYQDEKVTGASYGFLIQAVNSST